MDKKTRFKIHRLCWFAWWIGTILIILSYTKAVNVYVGWIGFSIAGISVISSVIINKYWKIPKYQESEIGNQSNKINQEGKK